MVNNNSLSASTIWGTFCNNDNDNEEHFFSKNNVQCYEYIVWNKSTLGKDLKIVQINKFLSQNLLDAIFSNPKILVEKKNKQIKTSTM